MWGAFQWNCLELFVTGLPVDRPQLAAAPCMDLKNGTPTGRALLPTGNRQQKSFRWKQRFKLIILQAGKKLSQQARVQVAVAAAPAVCVNNRNHELTPSTQHGDLVACDKRLRAD